MANLFSISILVFLIPTILIITVAAFFIYKAVFDKHTNKVLESGDTKKRKWIAPWGLALIVFFAQLLLVAGIVYPLSMFSTYSGSKETGFEICEDYPCDFDISDSVYSIDESKYTVISKQTEDGITYTVYKNNDSKDKEQFVVLGELEKEPKDGLSLYLKYLVNGEDKASFMCSYSENNDLSKVYFKCEVIKSPYTATSLMVGVVNKCKYEMSSLDESFDKDLTINL